jgi:hypothetical protein
MLSFTLPGFYPTNLTELILLTTVAIAATLLLLYLLANHSNTVGAVVHSQFIRNVVRYTRWLPLMIVFVLPIVLSFTYSWIPFLSYSSPGLISILYLFIAVPTALVAGALALNWGKYIASKSVYVIPYLLLALYFYTYLVPGMFLLLGFSFSL